MDFHLIVLVHGLWGNPTHFDYISSQVAQKYSKTVDVTYEPLSVDRYKEFLQHETDQQNKNIVVIYRTQTHTNYSTYDGIDICGTRVFKEIETVINNLNGLQSSQLNSKSEKSDNINVSKTAVPRVSRFSILGYSLGGLMCRYAIGLMYKKSMFKHIEPMNFNTFCSPHVGVLAPGSSISINLFNAIAPCCLASTGKQLFLKDNFAQSGKPLLYHLASPNSCFYLALQEFKNKALYCNIVNDIRTSWFNAGISTNDPYQHILEMEKKINISYITGYSPIVLDASIPMTFKNENSEIDQGRNINVSDKDTIPVDNIDHSTDDEVEIDEIPPQALNYFKRKWNWIIMFINIFLFSPLLLIKFLGLSVYQTFLSNRRLSTFVSQTSNSLLREVIESDVDQYSSAPKTTTGHDQHVLDNVIQNQADDVMQSVYQAITSPSYETIQQSSKRYHKHHLSSSSIVSMASSVDDGLLKSELSSDHESTSVNNHGDNETSPILIQDEDSNIYTLPDYDLNSYQLDIIHNLNEIDWKKYPIFLKVSAAHAASIVRYEDPGFEDGKIVIKHWLDNVLKI